MKNTKLLFRIAAGALAALMFSAALVSCGKKDTGVSEDDEEGLKEGGLQGYTLNVLSKTPWYTDTPGNLMYTEEANGDTIREAVYSRNNKVQSKYGLEVTQTYLEKEADLNKEIVKITASQDDAYQVATSNYSSCASYIPENIYNNVANLPYVDFKADYWDDESMELLSINGFKVGLIGDLIFETYESMMLTMYNTPMANDFDIDNLYDVTNAGGWTYERMMTEMEKVITDLDNDGQYGFNDRIGLLYCSNNLTPYFTSAGITFVTKDNEGLFQFDEGVNEKASMVGELAAKLIRTKGYAADWLQMSSENAIVAIISMIENKNALFQNMGISQVRRFYREIKTDFGLLPMPKLNEEQEKYYSSSSDCCVIVPSSNLDLDKTGFALEALGQASSEFPNTYFHVCLESKFTRDEESIDMIMLCYRNKILDPLNVYGFGGFSEALGVVVKNGRSYDSVYANLQDAIDESILEYSMIDAG